MNLKLVSAAHRGFALGHHDGRTYFVRYGLPLETVRAKVIKVRRRIVFAHAVDVLDVSPSRVPAPCSRYGPGLCGGCHWQHAAYEEQLLLKRRVVTDALRRIGGLDEPPVSAVTPSPSPWRYRIHATLTVSRDGHAGFWSDENDRVIPLDTCPVLKDSLDDLLPRLRSLAPAIRRLRLQAGSDDDDRLILAETDRDMGADEFGHLACAVNVLTRRGDVVTLAGARSLRCGVGGRSFRVTAGSFFQANLACAERLLDVVMECLGPQSHENVLDLYCGVGLFTAFAAEKANRVFGIEGSRGAMVDAAHNLADLENVTLLPGGVETRLPGVPGPIHAVLADPPRTGLSPRALRALADLSPDRIVYVSCDPATLARDLGILGRSGYGLDRVQPVDMFPQTFHIETVAILSRS